MATPSWCQGLPVSHDAVVVLFSVCRGANPGDRGPHLSMLSKVRLVYSMAHAVEYGVLRPHNVIMCLHYFLLLFRFWFRLGYLTWIRWWLLWPIKWTHSLWRLKTSLCSDLARSQMYSVPDNDLLSVSASSPDLLTFHGYISNCKTAR